MENIHYKEKQLEILNYIKSVIYKKIDGEEIDSDSTMQIGDINFNQLICDDELPEILDVLIDYEMYLKDFGDYSNEEILNIVQEKIDSLK